MCSIGMFDTLDQVDPVTFLAPVNAAWEQIHPDFVDQLKKDMKLLRQVELKKDLKLFRQVKLKKDRKLLRQVELKRRHEASWIVRAQERTGSFSDR